MIMGKVLKDTNYGLIEYLEAVLITVGVAVFSLASQSGSDDRSSTTLGYILLSTYIISDSFTSQWQSRVYKDYGKIDQWHMMFGVNVSAIILTLMALVASGDIPSVCEFLWYNPLGSIQIH